jgi:hypothetical protein
LTEVRLFNLEIRFDAPNNWEVKNLNGHFLIEQLSEFESEEIHIYCNEIPTSLRSSNFGDIIAHFLRSPESNRNRNRNRLYESDNPIGIGNPPDTLEGRAREYKLTSLRFGEGREIWVFVRKDQYLIDIELIDEEEGFQSFRNTIVTPFLRSIRITRASS